MPSKRITPRKGCVDVWNAFMVRGAIACGLEEIPFCPTTLTRIPERVIAYSSTKSKADSDALVHFYQDDQKFDGTRGIWHMPSGKIERLKKFAGVITPDFSTYQDMHRALKVYATFRMRAFGYWLTTQGIPVVNNVRWGDPDTYDYSFAGIPEHSVVAVGTHGCMKCSANRLRFQRGFNEMVKLLQPHTILIYGTAPDYFFQQYWDSIRIHVYPSQINLAMAERWSNE